MLVVVSPAKRIDWDRARAPETEPVFAREAGRLAAHGRQLSLVRLKAMMSLSDDLTRQSRERFRAFRTSADPGETRAAVFAFAGDTYQGFHAASLDEDALRWAQQRLRILSGLYGVLRPMDAIQAYRLEMGCPLKTRRGTTLYEFWGDRIARQLRADAERAGTGILLNCASREYFDAVDPAALDLRVISPVFLEERDGEARILSFFAKRARGAMARFVCEARLERPEDIPAFDYLGYRFDPGRSEPDRPAFVRDYPDPSTNDG